MPHFLRARVRREPPANGKARQPWLVSALAVAIALVFVFQIYVLAVHGEGDKPLPPLFGNFEAARAALQDAPPKENFTFAVVGDTRGANGVFEQIVQGLRVAEPDFVVLLGDCTEATEDRHRFFRGEITDECTLPCPMFYVVGNHDVDERSFPLSRFEQFYGPTLFSFEYQNCLFIALRTTGDAHSQQASLDFLKSFTTAGTGKYRRVFVFMHYPPPVPSFDSRKFIASDAFLPLFHDLHVSYVLASHYHGYARTRLGDTTYIITGGGGARLDHSDKDYQPFYHAVLLQVGKDHVSERILHARGWHDPEDQIEQFAVSMVFPWMSHHRGLLGGINAAFLLLLVGMAASFRKRRRAPSL
jgi:predicted phosphodiesterase